MTDYAELMKRLRNADEYDPLGYDGWEAADAIALLIAERDEARAEGSHCYGKLRIITDERDALATEVRKLQAEHRRATDDAITEGARVDALTKEVARRSQDARKPQFAVEVSD